MNFGQWLCIIKISPFIDVYKRQGEDVVAGIRTPQQITKIGSQRWAERAGISEEERVAKYPSMEEAMPEIYKELDALQTKLENHYRDMQDMDCLLYTLVYK